MKSDRSVILVAMSLLVLGLGSTTALAAAKSSVPVAENFDDAGILQEASRQIRRYAFYTIFDDVALEAKGGHVVLAGQVLHPWRRKDIERIVLRVPGVRSVENNLEVLPVSPFDDEIRYRVARAIYGSSNFVRYANRANPPIHIVVKNGNVTLTGVVHNAVDRALAERAARFAATYFDLDNRLLVETEMNRARS